MTTRYPNTIPDPYTPNAFDVAKRESRTAINDLRKPKRTALLDDDPWIVAGFKYCGISGLAQHAIVELVAMLNETEGVERVIAPTLASEVCVFCVPEQRNNVVNMLDGWSEV